MVPSKGKGEQHGPSPGASERDLVTELRDVNEQLVLAGLRAQELAEEAVDARARAQRGEQRFQALVNTVAAVVWSADATGEVRFDAQRWRALTGLVVADSPGRWDWLAGVDEVDRERVRAEWSRCAETGEPYDCEHGLGLRDGSTAWVRASAVRIVSGRADVREWVGMMEDITVEKVMEQTRERFIGVLGHDLRTPLSAIGMAAANLLSLDDVTPGHERSLLLIQRCTGRMQRMIDDVLDFTRGRLGGGIPLSLKPADFGQICRTVVDELRAVHPEREVRLVASGDLAGVWDEDRVQQAVSNLVGNAIQHGTGTVEVIVTGSADGVVLVVNSQNKGAPVPADVLPHLFEPFRRGGDPSHPGLGLGLYIVHEIVSAHGGTVSATSSAATGTTFTTRWMRETPPEPRAPVPLRWRAPRFDPSRRPSGA